LRQKAVDFESMMLDYNSLLLALGVSASCLAVTLLGSWMARRAETFLLTCTCGLVLVISGIFVYSLYVTSPDLVSGVVNFILFQAGFATVWGASYQFRTGRFAPFRIGVLSIAAMVLPVGTMLAGYDGLAFILDNAAIALLLVATAREYWVAREEAPGPIFGITALYLLTAFSFALCSGALIWEGKMVLGAAPNNWAEDVSIAISIASMTGIGALSLALHQWRLAARHRIDAITDPLTGLLNRRALFDRHGKKPLAPSTAVILFDLDYFKSINDRYGHNAGDRVLRIFAGELEAHSRPGDTAARFGGEEFALVVKEEAPGRAGMIAERIRKSFSDREVFADDQLIKCTVSVGVAPGHPAVTDFELMLGEADKALYAAKRAGRNRVETAGRMQPVNPSRAAS
jgi:diguanylate cyclase (GGDEF)-like protein